MGDFGYESVSEFCIDNVQSEISAQYFETEIQSDGENTSLSITATAGVNSRISAEGVLRLKEKSMRFLSRKDEYINRGEFWFSEDNEKSAEHDITATEKARFKAGRMNGKSKLEADKLKDECARNIDFLKKDTEEYKSALADLKESVSSASEVRDNLLEDYELFTKICILADEKDIGDYDSLRDFSYKSFDGAAVNSSIRKSIVRIVGNSFKTAGFFIICFLYMADKNNVKNSANDSINRQICNLRNSTKKFGRIMF